MVINARPDKRGEKALTEDELIEIGIARDLVGHDPAKPWAHGSTNPDGRETLFGLPEVGVETRQAPNDSTSLQALVSDGYPVSASVHPYYYWPAWTGAGPDWNHEILVIGVQHDGDGNVSGYMINDTGLGECGMFVSKDDFDRALIPGASLTVGKQRLQ